MNNPPLYGRIFSVLSYCILLTYITQKYLIKRFSANFNDDVYRVLKDEEHPNLPKIYEVCWDSSGITVLEEYIRGERLDRILEDGPLGRKLACRYACQLCDALTFLHSKKIIHRDIKPSNIIITPELTAVLIDLSIAKTENPHSGDTRALGTPGFAAPEQFGISPSAVETDIYALGTLLNLMLTGEHPTVKNPKGLINMVVSKATSTQISKRYHSAADLKRALKRFI